jgi:flagellar hook-length control protein FliK
MQIASSSSVTPLSPPAAAGAAATPPSGDSTFARLLSAHQAPARAPAAPTAAAADNDAAPTAEAGAPTASTAPSDAEAPVDAAPTAKPAADARGRAARGTARAARPANAPPASTTACDEAKSDATKPARDKDDDDKAATSPPGAADPAAAVQRPAGDTTPAPRSGPADPPTGVPASGTLPVGAAAPAGAPAPLGARAAADGTAPARPAAPGDDRRIAAEPDKDKPASLLEAAAADANAAKDAKAMEREASDHKPVEPRLELPTTAQDVAPSHALGAATAPRSESIAASAPTVVAVPTPATSPEFRQALGVQVSVLARDGVQHAELHLNPADMGPISVQIALEGTRAQVDFGADSLATRQIIETGLPELASALRDAGFTLTGGGVSQHARDQARGDAEGRSGTGGSRRVEGRGGVAGETRVVNVRLPQGAVDLYA